MIKISNKLEFAVALIAPWFVTKWVITASDYYANQFSQSGEALPWITRMYLDLVNPLESGLRNVVLFICIFILLKEFLFKSSATKIRVNRLVILLSMVFLGGFFLSMHLVGF